MRRIVLTLLIAACACLPARDAHAGTYTVRACWPGEPAGEWSPLDAGGLSYNRMLSCANPIAAGLYVYMPAQIGLWQRGTAVGTTFAAPAGTRISAVEARVTWGHESEYLGTAATWPPVLMDPGSGAVLSAFPPRRADDIWLAGIRYGRFRASGLAAPQVAFAMRCGDPPGCSLYEYNAMGARDIVVTITDDAAPAIVAGEPLPSGWRRDGSIPLSFTGSDAVGVYELELKLDGDVLASAVRGGCYEPAVNTLARPCVGSPTVAATLDVASLADGAHDVRVRAVDPAGNAGERVVPVLVDHTPPVAPQGLSLEGGDVWRARGAVNVSWTNPPQPGVAPIEAAHYELCPATNPLFDKSGCVSGSRTAENISHLADLEIPGTGAWKLRIALRDAAGNVDLDRVGTLTETLRFDPGAPSVNFVTTDPQDPTRIGVVATDDISGVGRVEIEARRKGDASWRALSVSRDGTRYTGVIDDDALPSGTYTLRARATDLAGNERSTDTAPEVKLPLRAGSRMELVDHRRLRFGASTVLRGRLTDARRRARGQAPVEVLEKVDRPGAGWRRLATITSSSAGRFSFKARSGPSRTLRFRYLGTATTLPRNADVDVQVRAAVTINTDRRQLRNGESLQFSGRLRGEPIPEKGKLLTLQARTSRGWRTFANPRAGRNGRWSHRYRFTTTTVTTRFAFRVLVPRESAYPYAAGTSPAVRVLVRG